MARCLVVLLVMAAALAVPASKASAQPAPSDEPAGGSWSVGPPMPIKRGEVGVAALNGEIFVAGGDSGGTVDLPVVQAFDPAIGAWEQRTSLPRGLARIALASLEGRLYAFGGVDQTNHRAVADCWVYDPASDVWLPIAPLPSADGPVAVAVLDGHIHALVDGGQSGGGRHEVYDPASDSWSSAAPLPEADRRDQLGLAAYGEHLYAMGGRLGPDGKASDLAEAYDPATDSWSELARLPTARGGGATAAYHGRVLYIGGDDGEGHAHTQAFDPASGGWRELAPPPVGRRGTGAVVLGDRLYLPGGLGLDSTHPPPTDTLFIFSQP